MHPSLNPNRNHFVMEINNVILLRDERENGATFKVRGFVQRKLYNELLLVVCLLVVDLTETAQVGMLCGHDLRCNWPSYVDY